MGGALAAFSQWFRSWEMPKDPPMLQKLMGAKGAHLHAEPVCEGHPYILDVHPFKDNYMNVLFCSLPVLFEPCPLPSSAFLMSHTLFLTVGAEH